MSMDDARRFPQLVPPWTGDEPPTEEECLTVAEEILERGFVGTTAFGETGEYRLSSRPRIVGGGS